ncbi:hypothetical protein RI030_01295 [Aphanizomenon flos-aquae NRERC-008]|jgi:hypothetical protein|uniref:Uncharacterized protein n=1 Tax=Aphanizomenon flos-aquae FACHB-1249 TaxID=2692889 RepID=A0ABR8IPI5_APHFL|nr:MULTISPECIES: hypothetical protein [Aphanizomenon]MDJ0505909.1 hypothetical protein [Nostocales cyanobacterium LE14-WE12]MBD2390576.1 hypothetical protein [Aphanizomenon flos-aquae FACHB-1171]MBD2558396.1 hypothetical protein [Aphanizomenon flos-aquae FACHB-1290]MBD2632640.1 hypothetical protein [Aphanizomenon sp. FACHB-1399]MBD2640909.1 hypothetical protein [Aphanizomenon sp. FACHB-1401]
MLLIIWDILSIFTFFISPGATPGAPEMKICINPAVLAYNCQGTDDPVLVS